MPAFDSPGFDHLLRWIQSGVVSRRQLIELHAKPHDIRRMLRNDLHPTWLPGVYVNHNGPLTREQRAWAVVLHFEPAVLCGRSALPDPPRGAPIEVAVDVRRKIPRTKGVKIRRMVDLEARTHPLSAPPRLQIEHAVIDLAEAEPDTAARFRVLADACQSRKTSAKQIAEVLGGRRRVRHGAELRELLDDLDRGACSVLERAYLDLERRHGLPGGTRQLKEVVGGRTYYRDVDYPDQRVKVELDGRPFHDTADARDRDHERDLDTLVASDALTVRLTYGQVCTRGCETARRIAVLLERRGWPGQFRPCPDCQPG